MEDARASEEAREAVSPTLQLGGQDPSKPRPGFSISSPGRAAQLPPVSGLQSRMQKSLKSSTCSALPLLKGLGQKQKSWVLVRA